ncbi:DedA family protein [Paenibacillus sp. P26]|nr:DedA family protein [Paenibacillus sp. P26]
MKEALIAFIQHYGYVAVFISMMLGVIGIPIPIEFLLLFAGSIVVAAKLQIIWLVVTAWLGAMAGMCVNYSLGRTIGISSISKITKYIHLPEERLNEWSLRFQRSGPAFITLGYFVAGLRHASPFIAGASGMTFRRFAVYAGAGDSCGSCYSRCLGEI